MLFWVAIFIGVLGLVSLILIHEFNDGCAGLIAPILTGVYLVVGVLCALEGLYLASVLCFLPMVTLTLSELILEVENAE